MDNWTPQEERDFQDLVQRAKNQSHEYYIKSGGSTHTSSPYNKNYSTNEDNGGGCCILEKNILPTMEAYPPVTNQKKKKTSHSQVFHKNSCNKTAPKHTHYNRQQKTSGNYSKPNINQTPLNNFEEKETHTPDKSLFSMEQISSLLSKLDDEGLMLGAIAWNIYKKDGDISMVLAILYILFV